MIAAISSAMEIVMSRAATSPFRRRNGNMNGEQNGTYIAIFWNKELPDPEIAVKYPMKKESIATSITGIIAEFKSSILLTEAPHTAFSTA